jgi:hypothetical protein
MIPPGHILTAATGARIDMASQPDLLGSAQLKFYTGHNPETPGYLQAYWDGAGRSLALFAPFAPAGEGASLLLNDGGSASLNATQIVLAGNVDIGATPYPGNVPGYIKDHFGYAMGGIRPGTRLAGAATDSPFVQAGTQVVTFTAANGNLNYPIAFPNGVLAVLVSNGDGSAKLDVILATRTTGLASTGINAVDAAGGFITGDIRVNYLAIGW